MAAMSGTHSEKEDETEKENNHSRKNAEERGTVRKT